MLDTIPTWYTSSAHADCSRWW